MASRRPLALGIEPLTIQPVQVSLAMLTEKIEHVSVVRPERHLKLMRRRIHADPRMLAGDYVLPDARHMPVKFALPGFAMKLIQALSGDNSGP